MRVEEVIFWAITLGIIFIPGILKSAWRHRHLDYSRRTQFRTITERETYERWDDKTPVISETRERVQNADFVRVDRGNDKKSSPVDRVKAMGGR